MSDELKYLHPLSPHPLDLFPAHSGQDFRLSWAERLARNTRGRSAPCVDITLFGVPLAFATLLGLSIV